MKFKHITEERRARIAALCYDYTAQRVSRIKECNLCGETRLTNITHVDRYGFPVAASACNRCGLTFLNPVMISESYADFYARVYRPLVSAYHGRLINAQTIQGEQVEYAHALGVFLRPWLGERRFTTLLDIGGSTGVVARELAREFALKATVLDPAAAELDWAAGCGMETIGGFLEDYDASGRKFDLVILCQTIDHLTDATGSMRKIRELMAPDGLLFVDIVDFRAAYLRVNSVEGAIKLDHPYYFTEDTAEALFSRVGLRVLQKNYAADHLHVGYLCVWGEPSPNALPSAAAVRELFREVRYLQNAPV